LGFFFPIFFFGSIISIWLHVSYQIFLYSAIKSLILFAGKDYIICYLRNYLVGSVK
jgi:hypothetical protein